MKHLIAYHFLRVICLGHIMIWGLTSGLFAQKISGNLDSKCTYEVEFLFIPNKTGAPTRLLSDYTNINLDKYPNAEIGIRLSLVELRERHQVKVSYPSKLGDPANRFQTINKQDLSTIKKYRLKNEKIKANAEYQINIGLRLSKKRNNDNIGDKAEHKSAKFKIMPKATSLTIIKTDYLKQLQEAQKKLNGYIAQINTEEVTALCTEIEGQFHANELPEQARKVKSEINTSCNEYLSFIRKAEKDWDDVKKAADKANGRAQKKAFYNSFINNNPNNPYINDAKEAIAALDVDTSNKKDDKKESKEADKKDKKKGDEKQPELTLEEKIAKNFKITELGRKDLGDQIRIELQYSNSGDKIPKTIPLDCSDRVSEVPQNSNKKTILVVDKGVKCVIEVQLEGVAFTKENNVYIIDTEVGPLSVDFVPYDDNAMLLTIKDGKPPFTLLFFENKELAGMIEQIELDENQQFLLTQDNPNIPGPGSYILQVLDATQNNYDAAVSSKYFTKQKGIWTYAGFWVSLVLLLAGGGVFYFYRKIKNEESLSKEEEDDIIAKREALGINNHNINEGSNEETGSSNFNTNTNESIRKNIKISTLSPSSSFKSNGVGLRNKSMHASTLTFPKFKTVDLTPGANELLMGNASEYRKLDLEGDQWKSSIVSELYIRELVAYRIEQYVFEEYKSLLSSKGIAIPEIGGWIMGKYVFDEQHQKYLVSFDRFIQVQKLASTSTQFVFDANAWQVLEKAKDAYYEEQLEVVGWFHTHPGWGVFLSNDDVNTHETFFKKPYHIAMVLETINEPFEVGFFTRRKEETELVLNNNAKAYYRWEDFRKWLGKIV